MVDNLWKNTHHSRDNRKRYISFWTLFSIPKSVCDTQAAVFPSHQCRLKVPVSETNIELESFKHDCDEKPQLDNVMIDTSFAHQVKHTGQIQAALKLQKYFGWFRLHGVRPRQGENRSAVTRTSSTELRVRYPLPYGRCSVLKCQFDWRHHRQHLFWCGTPLPPCNIQPGQGGGGS